MLKDWKHFSTCLPITYRVNPGCIVGGIGMHFKMGGKREVVHLQ